MKKTTKRIRLISGASSLSGDFCLFFAPKREEKEAFDFVMDRVILVKRIRFFGQCQEAAAKISRKIIEQTALPTFRAYPNVVSIFLFFLSLDKKISRFVLWHQKSKFKWRPSVCSGCASASFRTLSRGPVLNKIEQFSSPKPILTRQND